jgi:hypothetical protein
MGLPGVGGVGFGGVRVRNRADVQREQLQQQQRSKTETQEDPQVFDTNPPPGNAKFLTKVGWCEIQVFGHTFPTMHLPQRLGQLNAETNFAPGKSGIDLMDETASMIEASMNHKKRKQAVKE